MTAISKKKKKRPCIQTFHSTSLTSYSLVITLHTTRSRNYKILPSNYMFCTNLRIKSDYCSVQK